jgi:hypothetical protein
MITFRLRHRETNICIATCDVEDDERSLKDCAAEAMCYMREKHDYIDFRLYVLTYKY